MGLHLAYHNPECIQAYIGAGQFINTKLNEKIGYEQVLKSAYEKNNKTAIHDLEELDSFRNDRIENNGQALELHRFFAQ